MSGRVRKDEPLINLEVQGAVTSDNGDHAIIGALLDISVRRKREEELHRSQKLESLAILAGGPAHQFNNIMTALTGNIILAKMFAKPGSEVSDNVLCDVIFSAKP